MRITYPLLLSVLLTSIMFGQMNNSRNIPFGWKTDTSKTEIDLSEISIVMPRGSFQTLDYPAFINKDDGLKSFYSQEPIMFVEANGYAKAYPLNMLSVHEIANDTIGSTPILATFCPLCNSGIVYDRRLKVDGKDYLLEFEVSGMLRKSDMVMADKQTETWWQQLMGKAIVGELAGTNLKIIPSLVITVEEFFNRFPNGKILSKLAGDKESQKYYGQNFYKNYDASDGKPYGSFLTLQVLIKGYLQWKELLMYEV